MREPDPAMSPSERLMCEWEARHDVAARGRVVDPAAAMAHYLSHVRVEEERRHSERAAGAAPRRPDDPRDTFRREHPLAASWFRWGDEPAR